MFQEWESPEAVFQILKKLSEGQPCDFSGVSDYRMIEEQNGIQWPYPESNHPQDQERRLFEDGQYFHLDGRARFLFEMPRSMPEPPNERFPFLLLTGRGSASQWHTETRTKKSAVLRKLSSENIYVSINPVDANSLGIRPNELVFVQSQRGRIRAKAFVSHSVQPGQVFIPMHYVTTNILTDAVFDPHSKQPSYKACAVRLRKSF